MPHLLSETALEILQEHVAEKLLDIALQKDHIVTVMPAMHAGIERTLKLCHGVSVIGCRRKLFDERRCEVDFGGHCRL